MNQVRRTRERLRMRAYGGTALAVAPVSWTEGSQSIARRPSRSMTTRSPWTECSRVPLAPSISSATT